MAAVMVADKIMRSADGEKVERIKGLGVEGGDTLINVQVAQAATKLVETPIVLIESNDRQLDRIAEELKHADYNEGKDFGSTGTGVTPNLVNRNQCGQ